MEQNRTERNRMEAEIVMDRAGTRDQALPSALLEVSIKSYNSE